VTAAASSIVLDADGLDRLELVLGGWLPASALGVSAPGGGDLVLTDAENTPLARLRGGDAPGIARLAPLARGSGPQWDSSVRLSADDVRARIGDSHGGEAVAVAIDDLPTLADVASLEHATRRPGVDVVVVVVPARRRGRPGGEVGWAGITRAAWAVADDLEAAPGSGPAPTVVRLVLPGAGDGAAPDLRTAGIASVVRLADLRGGEAVPDDTHHPASAKELERSRRAASGPGAVVFFTGLSGSGKSTIARALADELADDGPRRVTLLDGDEVRQHLSRGLGFDAASREINVDRIAWVASLVAAHGGIAVAAPIAPFAAGRRNARALAEQHGAFVLVWVSTPLDVCESRDRKGLYAKARAGEVDEFTGISSPYEEPDDADVVIDTTAVDVPEAVGLIRDALDARLGDPPSG
jgi:sulfate adenylyltransferase